MKASDIIKNGLIKENPTWVLVLGMCPTLATTTSAVNGMMMGLATTFVLLMSNIVISLLKSMIPDKVRIPAFIVVIATFVTIVQMVMQAYMPDMYETLGLFIPLIVVSRGLRLEEQCVAFAARRPIYGSGLHLGTDSDWPCARVAGCRCRFRPQHHRWQRRHAALHPCPRRLHRSGIFDGIGEETAEKVIKKVK